MENSLVLFVNRTHQSGGWWQNLVDKDKDGLLRCELDTLADHVNELPHRQVLIGDDSGLARARVSTTT